MLIIKHSNIAEGQLERRRKDMTNLILLAVVIRIIVSIIVVNGNAFLYLNFDTDICPYLRKKRWECLTETDIPKEIR